ncbi:MAG: hypothetical protein OXH69_17495 [Acidobacteria bacterium]|nr:hypothetical protein [Acidobacteriota bacterium]
MCCSWPTVGRAAAVDGYFETPGEAGRAQIGLAAVDMWPACIGSVRDHTEAVIVLDKSST